MEIEENPDLTHEDVKAFMNEPEPEEPKAPPPLILDDLAPMEQQEAQQNPGRLTTMQITANANAAAKLVAESFAQYITFDFEPQKLIQWASIIINSAAHPNPLEVMREIYETELMERRETHDEYWVPFGKMSPAERAPWLVFRAVVVAQLGPVWAGY